MIIVLTKGSRVFIASVCLIIGIIIAVQYKAINYYEASLVPPSIEDLTAELNSLTRERDAVEEKVAKLNQELENSRNNNELMSELQKKLQLVYMSGGIHPCQGSGITIIMTNRSNGFQVNDSNSGSFAEASDLLLLVNELKASGAEAIAINDQRITAMSEIYWTGTMILVNETQIRPPYRIQAIGDPNSLEKGMLIKGGYIYELQLERKIDLKRTDQIKLPAFNGSTQMSFARAKTAE